MFKIGLSSLPLAAELGQWQEKFALAALEVSV